MSDIKIVPIQRSGVTTWKGCAGATRVLTERAHEVYGAIFTPQPGIIDGDRGGFETGELIAFLYARSFPREEWKNRFKEAINGMENVG